VPLPQLTHIPINYLYTPPDTASSDAPRVKGRIGATTFPDLEPNANEGPQHQT